MDQIITQIISEWGTFGLVLLGMCYLIYDNWKSSKSRKNDNNKTVVEIQSLSDKMDNLNDKINIVDTKVEEFKDHVNNKINFIETEIQNIPDKHINNMKIMDGQNKVKHLKQLDDLLKLGPKLHRIIQDANNKIGSDHIFVGSFHNGNSSLSGIPYYKFDIIAERFSLIKVPHDCEFAHMYKDADVLRYDMLPTLLIQKDIIYFNVPKTGENDLANYDDIIWRRMQGRGIRQIALKILKDSTGAPSGFVGVVKYNEDELNLKALEDCGRDLEEIYHESELKEKN